MTEVLEGLCQICESRALVSIPEYSTYLRVTSDIKPWKTGGHIAWCQCCHAVQAVTNESWHSDCEAIYKQYSIYELSGGAEQKIFDQGSGRGEGRSECLLRMLDGRRLLPANGKLLDIGCGNGAMLRAFGASYPGWSLTGQDVQSCHRDRICALPGVDEFIVGELPPNVGDFDLISLIHVFEHIPQPGRFLTGLISRLNPGGQVLIQVPDCEAAPYMYTVADHALHFSLEVLENLVRASGFEIVFASRAVFGKEITIVAKPNQRSTSQDSAQTGLSLEFVRQQVLWLNRQVKNATQIMSQSQSFGLFGTTVAATWLSISLPEPIAFYVDEDMSRVGKTHHGIAVLAPEHVPAGSDVFLCLPDETASRIASRLEHWPVRWHLPVDNE